MTTLELAIKLAEDRDDVNNSIVSNCPVPVLSTDRQGKWLSVNEPFTRMLAVSADDIVGVGWYRLLALSESERIKREWNALLGSNLGTGRILFNFKALDGRDVMAWATLVRLSGERWIGYLVPICNTPEHCPLHCFLLHSVQ